MSTQPFNTHPSSLIASHLDTWTGSIKTNSGAGRGSSKKRELYGIKKLRELILELAVRGLLVPQDPNDEPASELLKRIANEKAKLIKEGKIKNPKAASPASIDSISFKTPSGWRWESLDKLIIYGPTNGFSPKAVEYETPVRSLTLSATTSGVFKGEHYKFIKDEIPSNSELWLEDGDILVQRGNTIEYVGVPAVYRGNNLQYIYPDLMMKIRSSSYLNVDYIHLAMSSTSARNHLRTRASGTSGSMPKINQKTLKSLPLPLPPLAEQRRIVAKVDELMGLCDRLERETETQLDTHQTLVETLLAALIDAASTPAQFAHAWQRIATHFDTLFTTESSIDHLKQTILQLAVMGKIVEQDPSDEPASELLKRIATSLESTKRNKSKNVLTTNQEPFATPRGWNWATFPQLGEFGRGKSKHRPRNDPSLYNDGTHKMIQTGDVARSTGTINTHTALYNDIGLAQSRKWPKGTLCITIAANIADSGILAFDACFPDSVVGFIPSTELPSVRYFEYFLRTAKEHLMSFAPATAQKNINLGILEQVRIPLPPAAEQRRIVAKVDELMSLCDALKAKLQAAQTTQLHLTDTLASGFK